MAEVVDLSGAKLSGWQLIGMDLSEVNLPGADLRGARLTLANLDRAELGDADLRDMKLILASLVGAALRGVRLAGARFGGIVLGHVDLNEARGLSETRHEGSSVLGVDTIERSGVEISEHFLRGCGVSETLIEYRRSLVASPIEFYSCFIAIATKTSLSLTASTLS